MQVRRCDNKWGVYIGYTRTDVHSVTCYAVQDYCITIVIVYCSAICRVVPCVKL